jgi:hypothetical protein
VDKLEDIMRKLAICAAAVMLSLSASPIPANAQGFEIEIGPNGSQLRLRDGGCDPRYERCGREDWRDHDDDSRDGEWRQGRRFCTEDRALDKAEQMGIRRARIVSAGRHEIVVRGRDRYGQRVNVAFGRHRRCPVLG